ncbi:hypothetical protein ckrop_1839 [Corynebacterium kroppenstedtii DSM 44385]|uniref:Uncharacterized protein n=1 Tax=Corynebacterium kroppenstedtii (strain DSM 44385 / JCM 11950 / CIP 105744 / CCUG 35717) TaxID=645127 RepID=C4LL54_CORK4|nr:hypothetical protein ckrop_1839 [Corynebacterium kroppenstedtii DSM 44385]
MSEKWPKIDHIPPHFYFGAHIPPHFSAPGVDCPQFSVYRLFLPCVGASRQNSDHIGFCHITHATATTLPSRT